MKTKTLGGIATASLLFPTGIVAQTLTQHWKMDQPTLTFTAGSAPLTNETAGGSAALVNNANEANTAFWPVANQPGAAAGTGTSIALGNKFQRIQLGNVAPALNPFSISLWFKRNGTGGTGPQNDILSGNQGQAGRWNLSTSGLSGSTFNLDWFHEGGTGAFTFATGLNTNQWYHMAVTREAGTNAMRWYLNGQLLRTATDAASFTQGVNGVWLGRRPNFGETGFLGAFDDVRFHDGPLTQSAVIALVGDDDTDGLPDSWELSYFILPGEDPVADRVTILARQNGTGDPDLDTLDNLGEFNAATRPDLADSDRDGLSDAVESKTGTWSSATATGTDPLKPDSDGDGLLDGQENNSGTFVSATDTGTNPNLADSDGDTFGDYLEIARTSDPRGNTSIPGASTATPVVALDSSALAAGPLSSWANTGTVGRSFEADNTPVVETIGGVKGVTFFGGEVMTGPVAPPSLTGASPRTIQAWIFNPATSTEEAIVSWGRRDGPNGTLSSFFHGTSPAFGAVGNWGTPDMAWGPDAGTIAANVRTGAWTYVVYTYDGGSSNIGNVYSDGNLANTELLGALATFATDNSPAARPLPIRIAGQNAANGTLSTAGQKGSLTIARLRIHDRVLPAADLGFNDSDSDGMKDWFEDFYGLNKAVDDAAADTDGDGLTNLQEQSGGTHPSIADTDADGMPDGWEVANFGNHAPKPFDDADLDGSLNIEEYEASRGLLLVRGAGGVITGRTPFTGSSNPLLADSQPDIDNDTLPDGWENFYLRDLLSGPAGDNDGDTFTNDAEFIAGSDPLEPLSTPADTDADGLPDSWEQDNFGGKTTQTGSGDADGDLATNREEFLAGTDPNDGNSQPDSDSDGLPDGRERRYFGDLDETSAGDFDGDGFANGQELAAGSNPARRGNTPDNVGDTVKVAIATSAGLDEYSVTNNTWTFVRRLVEGEAVSVTFHQGQLYLAQQAAILKVNPADGSTVTLATRNTGDAQTAGWILSAARGLETGPDGKLYFSTAFGAPNGEGVFRLNADGTGFERFIARAGENHELFNAIDLAWKGNSTLYVTSRGAFDATNRPVYQFDAAGGFVGTLANSLQGPQGLAVDGDLLWVSGTNGASALVSLDTTVPAPVAPGVVRTGGATNPDVVEILGELHVVGFGGSIRKDVFQPALATVLASVGSGVNANDMAVFTQAAAPAYATWAAGFGLDPASPAGAPAGDADGDGTANEVEFALGLSPVDANSRFSITATGTAGAGLVLTWPSAPGISFAVRGSSDLVDWSTLEATVVGAAGQTTASWTAPAATGGRKFYRIEFTP